MDTEKTSRITYLGHSCVLISIGDTHVLTDPNLSRRIAFFIRRRDRVPLRLKELPPIDIALISHGHFDHLDKPTLRKLPRKTAVVVPPGLESVVRRLGKREVVILSPWQKITRKGVTVTAVPAKHFAGRSPLHPHSGYQGYIVQGSAVIYFAGDTALFDGLSEIRKKWNIDAALLPVGAYEPPPFRRHHMSPEDAVEAARTLGARIVIPIHWGAFKLSLEPMSEPIPRLLRAAEQAGVKEVVRVLRPGDSVVLDKQD